MNKNIIKYPRICYVDSCYLEYLRKFDERVSQKDNRKFLVLTIKLNEYIYAIPLTSQTSATRLNNNRKNRSKSVTTKITDGVTEIANILYNNMIPVKENVLIDFVIDYEKNTYEAMEERFIRKNYGLICKKALSVYRKRNNPNSPECKFLEKICCDFIMLEKALDKYPD